MVNGKLCSIVLQITISENNKFSALPKLTTKGFDWFLKWKIQDYSHKKLNGQHSWLIIQQWKPAHNKKTNL